MKTFFILFFLYFLIFCCSGQRKIPDNSISLELAGPAMLVSLNYERIFFHDGDYYISGRVGCGIISYYVTTLSFPLLVNGMYRVSKEFLFELGIGFNPAYTYWPDYRTGGGFLSGGTFHESGSFFDLLITGYAGIRIQKKKGFLFRLGFTPLIDLKKNIEERTLRQQLGFTNSFLPYAGMSFGYSF